MADSAIRHAVEKIATFAMQELTLLSMPEKTTTHPKSEAEAIDAALGIADALFMAVQARLDSETLKLRSRRNALQAINHLPEDVFQLILEYCLVPPSYSDVYDFLQRLQRRGCLLLVSVDWHTFMTRTPSLWRFYSRKAPTHINALSIKRSQSCPLICIDWARVDHERLELSSPWGLSAVDFQRCKHLEGFAVPQTLDLLQNDGPLLNTLHLWCTYRDNASFLAPGVFPCLKKLVLERLHLPWTAPPFSNLIELRLTHVSLELSVFLATLRASPSLVTLEVIWPTFARRDLDQDNIYTPLPQLQELTLVFENHDSLRKIVKSIDGTRLREMRIITEDDSEENMFIDLPRYVTDLLARIARNIQDLQLRIDEDEGSATAISKEDSESFLSASVHTLFNWLVPTLNQSSYKGIFNLYLETTEAVHPIGQLCHPILNPIHIELDDYMPDPITLLQQLCDRLEDTSWPFPQLRGLTLPMHKRDIDAVVQLLRQRYTGDSAAAPLSFLTFHVKEPRESMEVPFLLSQIPSFNL